MTTKKDVETFMHNLEQYVSARSRSDTEVAAIMAGRMKAFLDLDVNGAKDELPKDNPFVGTAMLVGNENVHLDDIARKLSEISMERIGQLKKFKDGLYQHWKQVRGTDAGEKLPMVNFYRDIAAKCGLPDIGAVEARKMVEGIGCYNNATDGPLCPSNMEERDNDDDKWKGEDDE